jgi:hypothetical protein
MNKIALYKSISSCLHGLEDEYKKRHQKIRDKSEQKQAYCQWPDGCFAISGNCYGELKNCTDYGKLFVDVNPLAAGEGASCEDNGGEDYGEYVYTCCDDHKLGVCYIQYRVNDSYCEHLPHPKD